MTIKFFKGYRFFKLPPPEEGGGGGSAPSAHAGDSATPASTTTSTPSPAADSIDSVEGTASDSVDFNFIFGDGDDSATPEVVSKAPPAPAATPASVVPKVEGAAEAPKPAATPAAGEVAPAIAAPAPTALPSAASMPSLDPYDPGAIASALQANEAQAIEHLASTVFKLSSEEIEELETNTAVAVPKLFAKAFVKSQHNMLMQIGRLVPNMVMRQGSVTKRNAENEGKFYSRWPDIKSDAHGELVKRYAVTYRQMHPEATLEQMIEDVGPMVMMSAKIVPTLQSQVQVPAAPRNASPMNGSRVQPSPFTPAAAVSGGAVPQPNAVEMSPVESMFNPPD